MYVYIHITSLTVELLVLCIHVIFLDCWVTSGSYPLNTSPLSMTEHVFSMVSVLKSWLLSGHGEIVSLPLLSWLKFPEATSATSHLVLTKCYSRCGPSFSIFWVWIPAGRLQLCCHTGMGINLFSKIRGMLNPFSVSTLPILFPPFIVSGFYSQTLSTLHNM